MISRRQYFSIVLTMIAIFLLFMGTQLGKEHWEREDPSAKAVETGLKKNSVWTAPEEGTVTNRNVTGVVYLGSEDSPGAEAYVQWARYAKRTLVFASSPEDPSCADAELILVPGDALPANTEALSQLMDKGVNVLCLSLPPVNEIKSNKPLRELLGINRVRSTKVRLSGVHLFGGFLLGGERIYRPETKKEAKERQDLPLDTPWYVVRVGTETYMSGILNDKDAKKAEKAKLKNEDMPAIMWRHHKGKGELFAVNGPYMNDADIAGGVVQSALSEIETTSIYPVLNAQVFSLLDFPALSNENSDELLPIYGREMTDTSRNIILPSLSFLPNRYGVAITAFAAPQFNYSDDNEPDEELAEVFRKELHALHGELGLSLRIRDNITIAQKIESDRAVLSGGDENVDIYSAYAEPEELDSMDAVGMSKLSSLKTVVSRAEDGKAPIDYLSWDVTLQRAAADAATHTYMQDIALLSRETSMAYDSCYCDFDSIWWPQTDKDRWQKLADKVLSNLITYRKPFEAFDRVTASDCDARIRRYLMTDYDYTRKGDEIDLKIPLLLTEACFVLRLNEETITEMEGGTFAQIEKDAYLLKVNRSYVRIKVAADEPLSELSLKEDAP